jgi:multidrug efflux pump subunit AcrA (membrane-fusion protein)
MGRGEWGNGCPTAADHPSQGWVNKRSFFAAVCREAKRADMGVRQLFPKLGIMCGTIDHRGGKLGGISWALSRAAAWSGRGVTLTRTGRIGIAVVAIAGLFVLYEIASSFVAYTAVAYAQSDLVAVAPEVSGRVIAVSVEDNQTVAKGELLATIDPVSFQLIADRRRAELEAVCEVVTGLRREVIEMRLIGARDQRRAVTTLAVALATVSALAVHADDV